MTEVPAQGGGQSDLRRLVDPRLLAAAGVGPALAIDWPAFYWLPSDIFGAGKVLAFGEVHERDGSPYGADMRALLKAYTDKLYAKDGMVAHAANEIEGFLFHGRDAERAYHETGRFDFISTGGYYHSLPGDALRQFIDTAAEVQRAMGFANEKDHPEVAPSQFEMNYSYTEASVAADQVQLYKLLSRQVAARLGMTACFLPKPVTGINGSGMHTNLSLTRQSTNLFYDKDGKDGLSAAGWDFIGRILASASDICLVLNSSVNSYRRLDPHFEAPNQIKASAIDRGSMVRIPPRQRALGARRGALHRSRLQPVHGDLHPAQDRSRRVPRVRRRGTSGHAPASCRTTSTTPSGCSRGAGSCRRRWGEEVHAKFAELKLAQAERCPKALGALIKASEVQYHHEVTNQFLWSQF